MERETQFKSNKLAVLIDAENASVNLIELLLGEIAKYGTAYVKRIYGDWTNPHLASWKDKLNKLALQPIQQFRYTTGKNSSDSALIIDAMDLLYTQKFDGFCIISSDSDFTRLASRIREFGLVVYGFGEKKTPEAFVRACDKFIYCEILKSGQQNQKTDEKPFDEKLLKLLKAAYEASDEEDGWANLGPFGAQLTKLSPSFDARNYGYTKLSELIRAIEVFEVKETLHGKGSVHKDLHIRLIPDPAQAKS
jgi:uncharacterized LabA/DUF88 family protein